MAIKRNKSYLDNPALQFISTALVDEAMSPAVLPDEEVFLQQSAAIPDIKGTELPLSPAQAEAEEEAGEPFSKADPLVIAPKKAVERKKEKPEFAVPMRPMYVEVRSKRLNLLLQPSLFNRLQKMAKKDGISVNELIHRALTSYAESRGY